MPILDENNKFLREIRKRQGVMDAVTVDVTTPFLDLFKGEEITSAAREIEYTELIETEEVAPLSPEDDYLGEHTKKDEDYTDNIIVPGVFKAEYTLTADDALRVKQGASMYVNNALVKAEDGVMYKAARRNKIKILKGQNLVCAKVLDIGEYSATNNPNKTIKFDLRSLITKTINTSNPFVNYFVEQHQKYCNENGFAPNKVLIGSKIVDHLLKDEKFMRQAEALQLGEINKSNVNIVIARIFNVLLEQANTTYDPFDDIVIANDNRMTLLNTTKLHRGYAGIKQMIGDMPGYVDGRYVLETKIDKDNKVRKEIAYSRFTPIIVAKRSVRRIDITFA
ncbi:major capsid protein [Sebaldella sp. S0638]|uniref:major capsid protein n=1 Tax=Sebaldella sp. S0638 TaxID=2957809 RepID=UPI00209CF652|nr:major capsid protein [Sebaldella sp. S0638]MCP1226687.1 major capsid protein [Sebaldella sp. S0638]